MFKPVQFRPDVEARVRWVEETDPAKIVEATYKELHNGTPPVELIRASTLAVVRSTELPPQHHGGPLHPVCGVHAVHSVAKRLPGETGFLPIIQHTALCNNHVHSPQMGPYLMPAIEPMQGAPGEIGSFHISDDELTEGMSADARLASDGLTATKAAFHKSLRALAPPAAERYFLWLLERLGHGEALDQLLPLAIARNGMDDHNFLFPVYSARALDCIGWEWADVVFRPAVRYQARRASRLIRNSYDFAQVEALIDEYKLLDVDIPPRSNPGETQRIGELGMQMGRNKNYLDNMAPMAQALAEGLSLEGAGEALSIGAAAAYICTSYGNPMDSHLHTGTTNRRYLLGTEGVSRKHKIEALLTGFTGPEVLLAERLLNWGDNLDGDLTAALPPRTQANLLDALVDSIEGQPWLDWRKIGVAATVAPDSVKEGVALARQYADNGYDPAAYFERLGEIACRDDFTEMHALKHFQAIVDEHNNTRQPYRWLHMAAAAKSAAVIHLGREHQVYEQAKALLAA